MADNNIDFETIVGLLSICIALCFQCVCLFLMRIVNQMEPSSRTITIRMWIHLAAAIDQLSFFAFHFKFNVLRTEYEDSTSCTVLRFLSSFTSTFFMMWVLVLTGFYFMLTVQPSKCYSFHAKFLSHCTIWVWTCTSSLIYLVLANLIRTKHSFRYIDNCWDDITNTIHFYSTYGNELVPFLCIILITAFARLRLTNQREIFMSQVYNEPVFKLELTHLRYKVNTIIVLCAVLLSYYIALTFRYLAYEIGSDWSLMFIQSLKGFLVGIVLCISDRNIIRVLKCRNDNIEESDMDDMSDIHLETVFGEGNQTAL